MSKQSAFAVILTFAAAIFFAVAGFANVGVDEASTTVFDFVAATFMVFLTIKGVKNLIAIRKSLTAI